MSDSLDQASGRWRYGNQPLVGPNIHILHHSTSFPARLLNSRSARKSQIFHESLVVILHSAIRCKTAFRFAKNLPRFQTYMNSWLRKPSNCELVFALALKRFNGSWTRYILSCNSMHQCSHCSTICVRIATSLRLRSIVVIRDGTMCELQISQFSVLSTCPFPVNAVKPQISS